MNSAQRDKPRSGWFGRAVTLSLVGVLLTSCEDTLTDVAVNDPLLSEAYGPPPPTGTMLLGTTGTGGTGPSTLFEIDPVTGATVRTIGPVGYIVNGMEFDPASGKLYGGTSVRDPNYNGLIEIDMTTGAGTPVGANGWGYPDGGPPFCGPNSSVTNITIDARGQMFGWLDPCSDDLVRIDRATGIATVVGGAGTFTAMNGLDFDNSGALYMIQFGDVHQVNVATGLASLIGNYGSCCAHHGDFDPATGLYNAIGPDNFNSPKFLEVVDISGLSVVGTAPLTEDFHVVTFVGYPPTFTHDFGDAPNGAYPTRLASNGARHVLGSGLFLGATVDGEPDGQPNGGPAGATGDDRNGSDDEDGVTFTSPLNQGAVTTVDVVASVGGGLLNAWVDFNFNGTWEAGAPEQIFIDVPLNAGTNSLAFTVPASTGLGRKFARFRVSTAGGLTPVGEASDGEVEDYLVLITKDFDFGDAPGVYPTRLIQNGARHMLGSGLFLGAAVDPEPDGQPNGGPNGATGDDKQGLTPDDEDGVTFTSALVPGAPTTVDVVASAAGVLNAWIDFNFNGRWQSSEQIFANEPLTPGVNSLSFMVPTSTPLGNKYARFRLNSTGGLTPKGMASDGEVEDYLVTIGELDFGDAPNGSYPTRLSSNGARHILSSGLFMGSTVDAELDGQPNGGPTGATGDDLLGSTPDDEDGVVFTSSLVPGAFATVDVFVSQPGILSAWIDFDFNGVWDPGDQIVFDQPVGAGLNMVVFFVPSGAALGAKYARFRLNTAGNLGPAGLAVDGEVEDYRVMIEPCTPAALGDFDGDRLLNCVETLTGVFVDGLDTGTNPFDPDTDNDNIDDGDEVLGTLAGLDLPGLGVSPVVPTILIEYDWFDDDGHSHRPTATQIAMVTASFAAQGIEVIHDYGQGPAPFDRGNLIVDADGNVDGLGPEYYAYKAANFDANRNGYFHYNMHPHQYGFGSSSGLAEVNGDDFITATLNFYTNNLAVAGTIQHELGHNLNLLHGGNVGTNRKPNYNSIMSYNYQFVGVDNNCDPIEDGILDYSHGVNPPLDENNLNENLGICGGPPPWDWNLNTVLTDMGVVADINRDWTPFPTVPGADGIFEVLFDYDDWSNLSYAGITDADGAGLGPRPIVTCQEPPDDLSGN